MIVLPYLRKGMVYNDQDAFENGDAIGSYRVVIDLDGRRVVETDPIGGKTYRAIASWSDAEIEKDRDFGYLPLKRQ